MRTTILQELEVENQFKNSIIQQAIQYLGLLDHYFFSSRHANETRKQEEEKKVLKKCAGPPSTVGSVSDCESRGRWFKPRSGHILLLRFGHENISKTILILLLIQEGQLSVTGKRMGTKYW